jgi:hypothetical protein
MPITEPDVERPSATHGNVCPRERPLTMLDAPSRVVNL